MGGYIRLILGFFLATLLSYHGYRKRSLDSSGALAAFLVGFFTFVSSIRLGIIMIVFYQSSSILTKFKTDYKARLESDFRVGGQRDYFQVLACSIVGTGIAIIYNIMDVNEDFTTGGDPVLLDAFLDPSVDAVRAFLLWAYIGHY